MSDEKRVVLETDDIETLAEYFMAKHRRVISREVLDDFNLYGLIITVMADTMLVVEGTLTVEAFKPPPPPPPGSVVRLHGTGPGPMEAGEVIGSIADFTEGERMTFVLDSGDTVEVPGEGYTLREN